MDIHITTLLETPRLTITLRVTGEDTARFVRYWEVSRELRDIADILEDACRQANVGLFTVPSSSGDHSSAGGETLFTASGPSSGDHTSSLGTTRVTASTTETSSGDHTSLLDTSRAAGGGGGATDSDVAGEQDR